MSLKSLLERPLYSFPRIHAAVLSRRPYPDLNKIAWVSLISPGQTVLDIGANRGIYTAFFARKVGSRGRVCAFEPVAETCAALRDRCAAFPNVEVQELALADVDGLGMIYVPRGDFQQASLRLQTAGSWAGAAPVRDVPIRLMRLDSWVVAKPLDRLDFIKVDIEGAEFSFLQGARQTLGRFGPMVYMEISRSWLRNFGIAPEDVVAELRRLGYDGPRKPVLSNLAVDFVPICAHEIDGGDFLFRKAEA
jgi:FkbM family methyltransferase